ncbi:hypothetical protein TNCV_2115901 [Trichonephila clavipes]|nr:hypothetical protein TNCV_2115901 [Trichonephila clavipes]
MMDESVSGGTKENAHSLLLISISLNGNCVMVRRAFGYTTRTLLVRVIGNVDSLQHFLNFKADSVAYFRGLEGVIFQQDI